ncbi:MAG: 2OG-Fe(II) oxygenase [Planctomycetaceae bacterium]
MRDALGLEKSKLTAHLYKLLLYEKGSFFLPHRDGEKLDGMVATLLVCLPSPHTGGELVVSHEGRRHEIAFTGAASGLELSYAAFYADCEHEVLPVRDGYRLCLSYNLTLARSRRKAGITAPRTGKVIASISKEFRDWPSQGDFQKVAVTLDHHYSQDGLKIDALKGVDRARADVLFDAAEQAGCEAHLALITHWQNGSADGADYEYSYGRGRYSSWSYDDEEEADEGTGYEMGEIYDESLSINHWSDRDGKKISLGEMGLSEDEIVSVQPREAWDLSREEFEGFTGNAGMTLERWYHRAAIIVWPKENHFKVLCDAGTDAAISGLESMVKKLKRARKSDRQQQRTSCLKFATAIIDTWAPRQFSYSSYRDQDPIDRSTFPLLLQELDDPDPICRFLAQVMPQEGEIQVDKSFPKFCKQHGWQTFEDPLTVVTDASSANTILRNATLLQVLCLGRDKNADRIALCRHLAEHAVAALEKIDKHSPKHDWQMKRIDRSTLLASLTKSLISVESTEPLARLIDHTLSQSSKYDLTDVHLKTIFALESWLNRKLSRPDPVVSRWLTHCRTELEQRTAQAPTPPGDFRRPDKLSCRCDDCRELSRFLADAHESVHRFPVRKDRRQHLHQVIDGNGCDLTHVTTRTGSPHTLVCTKTTASYEAACKVYARDQEHLKRLRAIEKKISRKAES